MEGIERLENPTNKFLVELVKQLGITISVNKPSARLFFTNSVLCIRNGQAQGGFKDLWLKNCAEFMKSQIEIVSPKVIICLGAKAHISVMDAHHQKRNRSARLVEFVGTPTIAGKTKIFAVYHPGAYGLRARNKELQLEDWKFIGDQIN